MFAPGTVLETFATLKKAFHLSDKYQVPAIVLMDQFLCDSIMTEKGRFDFDEENDEKYLRHKFSDSGVSPRIFPCTSRALVRSTGNEHDPEGYISEDAENRTRMVDKRGKKISFMLEEIEPPSVFKRESAFLLTGWGSSKGSIIEACLNLRNEGFDVGGLIFRDLWPMDSRQVTRIIKGNKLIMVEQNSTCQLGQLIRQNTSISYFDSVLKYDGRPLYPGYIAKRAKQIMER